MDGKKEFVIQINGVKESISEVDELLLRLSNLQERLDKLQNATISVNVDAAEFPKVLPTSEEEKPPTATTAELMKQIEAAKELKQVHKEIAQGARDENGEYTNTLKGLRAQLSEMKKQLSLTELGTSAFDEMNKKVGSLNSEVKKLEQSYGDFQRNVGNYASAAEGFNKLTVTIGGVEKSFESLRAANRELQNEMNGIALRMKELQDSGQGASKEFEELSSKFEEIAKASESLDKASAYADRMKESIQDDSGAIGEMSRSFEAFNAVANIGVGVLGLFGSETEDLQKNINRTIQVTTVLKGIQELYNSQLQKGAPLMKAYQGAVNLVEKALYRKAAAQTADVAATNAATTATHTFSKALVATGIGAIVVAIGLLIANLDTLSEWFTKLVGGADNLSKGLDKIKEVASGVGNAIVNFIVQPFKTSMAVIKKIMEGDLKGAVTEYTEGIKKQVNVVAAYQEGAQKQAEKNQENHNKEMAKKRAKDTQNAIEENEAKYGSDWKYTEEANELYQQMFSDRLSMYDKDSEEYRQANNEKLAYDREYAKKQSENTQKAAQEAEKKRQEGIKAAKGYQKKLDEVNERIYKNELELISDTYEKKKKELEHQRERELKEAKDSAIKVNEQVAAINKKYENEFVKLEAANQKKLLQMAQEYENNRKQIINVADSLYLNEMNLSKDIYEWRNSMLTTITDEFIEPLDKDISNIPIKLDVFDKIYNNLIANMGGFARRLEEFGKNRKSLAESLFVIDQAQTNKQMINTLNTMGSSIEKFIENEKNYLGKTSSDIQQEMITLLSNIQKTASNATTYNIEESVKKSNKEIIEFATKYSKILADIDSRIEMFEKKAIETTSKTNKEAFNAWIDELNKEKASLQEAYQVMFDITNGSFSTIGELQVRSMQKYNSEVIKVHKEFQEEELGGYQKLFDELKDMQNKYIKTIDSSDNAFGGIFNAVQISNGVNELSKGYKLLTEDIKDTIQVTDERTASLNEEYAAYLNSAEYLEKYIASLAELQGIEAKPFESRTEEEKNRWATLTAEANKYKQKLEEIGKVDLTGNIQELIIKLDELNDGAEAVKKGIKDNENYSKSLSNLQETIKKFQEGSKIDWRDWAKAVGEALQFVSTAVSSIISNIAETMYNNATAAIEAQMDALEKETDAYEEKYQKDYDALEESLRAQEDLVAEHNDIINGLEGELANARGDRRLEVLDAITSEKAEREKALQKQKQLEKQRELMEKQKAEFDKQQEEKKLALEKQMDEEELKRKKLQKEAQTIQAVVNTGVGVTQALASGPPWISIPMAAIIGAMGAAQIAMINSQKYADGGLLVGNSHQNGGVKVLGGQAEVEGGEYITNKRTTKYNLELLDFINSQNGRIDESDILEFFNKKHTPKYSFNQTVFAGGGQLPNLTNPQSINQQRVIKTMNMDDRPIVVSVQEIVDTADNMRNVRVLSGEDDDWNL